MSILSQINLIINRFSLPDDYSIADYYYDLRRRTLTWLKACNKNINDANQQYTFPIEKLIYIIASNFLFQKCIITLSEEYLKIVIIFKLSAMIEEIHFTLHVANGIHIKIQSVLRYNYTYSNTNKNIIIRKLV